MRWLLRLLVVLVLLGAAPAAAQTLGVGAHAGVNLAKASGDAAVNVEFSPQPVGGAELQIGFTEPLMLRAGLDFSRKQLRVSTNVAGSPTVVYTLSYLALPVNLRYELGAGATEAYLFGGATLGVLIGGSQTRATGEDTDVKGALTAVEVTADIGAGIAYRLAPSISVALDVRFSLGLNDVAPAAAAIDVKPWSLQTIQILVGSVYTFGAAAPSAPSAPPKQ